MNPSGSLWAGDRRGLAAVEFALLAPVLLALLGGAVDFGLMMSGKSKLANGLAQAVQYAQLQGPGVSPATVQTVAQDGSSRSGVTGTVTVNVVGPACYCVTGYPVVLATPSTALSASKTCTGICPLTGAVRGAYVIITTSNVYRPLMPFYSMLASTTVAGTITVRLQ